MATTGGRKRAPDAGVLDLRLRPQDRTGGPPAARGDGGRRRRDSAPPRETRKRRRGRGGKGRSGIGRLIYWGAVLALWAVIGGIGTLVWIGIHLPPIQSLEIPKRPPSVLILGANGATLATRGDMGGAAVPLRELPDYVPKAFIAIEDRRFYSHHGVDPWGIMRAVIKDVVRRGASQGASTITQQLAKNLFLTQERTVSRKLQEVALALLARAQVHQGRDPRTLSQPRLFRFRRLRRGSRRPALFRQIGAAIDARRSRHAGRSGAIAVTAGAEP